MMEIVEPVAREHTLMLPKDAPHPRVCIFAAYNKTYAPIAEIARPNWVAYARRHGYAIRFYPEGWHDDPSQPSTYGDKGRFNWFFDLRAHCDIAVYLDIDSMFMNHHWSIESLLGEKRFLWTYGEGGPMSGLMIARTDELTEKHLRYAYERAGYTSNVRHGKIEPNGISDQDSMRDLMNIPPFRDTFGNCVEAREYGFCFERTYYPGAWILTCHSMPFEERLATMKEWSTRAIVA